MPSARSTTDAYGAHSAENCGEFAVAVLERVYDPVVQVIDKGLTLLRPCSDSSSSRRDSWEMPQFSSSTCSGSGV